VKDYETKSIENNQRLERQKEWIDNLRTAHTTLQVQVTEMQQLLDTEKQQNQTLNTCKVAFSVFRVWFCCFSLSKRCCISVTWVCEVVDHKESTLEYIGAMVATRCNGKSPFSSFCRANSGPFGDLRSFSTSSYFPFQISLCNTFSAMIDSSRWQNKAKQAPVLATSNVQSGDVFMRPVQDSRAG
jgi:hypothetical protein